MKRPNRLPYALFLAAAAGVCVVSCQQVGPVPGFVLPSPGPEFPPEPAAGSETAGSEPPLAPVRTASLPANEGDGPGGAVAWAAAPALRPAPAGVGPFLADVESRLPPAMGTTYRDPQRITWCHETTHGVQAALRIRHRLPAFYPGGGRCALVEPPALTLGDVAAAVPARFRGTRYNLYLVTQRRQWERDPLYVWDEWVAYDNGMTTGLEESGRPSFGASDDAVACIELSGYALAVAAAARRAGAPVSPAFRAFLAWELRRSLGLYARAMTLPAFAWNDRRLEQLWRANDPFLVEELHALYGDAVAVKDLLP
jgi:hypothetical protein